MAMGGLVVFPVVGGYRWLVGDYWYVNVDVFRSVNLVAFLLVVGSRQEGLCTDLVLLCA